MTILLERKAIRWVLRASYMKDGVRYYARDYGKRAFRIPIYKN